MAMCEGRRQKFAKFSVKCVRLHFPEPIVRGVHQSHLTTLEVSYSRDLGIESLPHKSEKVIEWRHCSFAVHVLAVPLLYTGDTKAILMHILHQDGPCEGGSPV